MNDGQQILVLLLCALVPIMIAIVDDGNRKTNQRKVEDAHAQYQAALDLLRQDPGSIELRQSALDSGRHYSDLARSNKRALFDEVALMNDLNAITPPVAKQSANADGAMVTTADDMSSRLATLKALFDNGAITEAEYQQRRSELINQI